MSKDVDKGTERRIRIGQTVRVVGLVVLALVLAGLALANQIDVEVDWLFDTTEGPLVVVIAISAGLGFLLGVLVAWRRKEA